MVLLKWMTEHSELRTMIEEGKDKLEWYRQVDPAKLNTLKQLMMDDNYKENMSTLIKTIYEFAFLTYSGSSQLNKNKPKMAYSRDFSKMAIKDYHGLTRTIKDCQGLSKTIKDCHGLS